LPLSRRTRAARHASESDCHLFCAVQAGGHQSVYSAAVATRPQVTHCHLGVGTLYRRTGKREQAEEDLTTAITMNREMDMRFWLEQAEAEIKGLA
jgi:hypothetical protein